MFRAAMTVRKPSGSTNLRRGGEKHHWLRGICSLYGIGRFRLADRKCVYVLRFCIQNMYALKPDLCQLRIYARPSSFRKVIDTH